MCTLNVLAKTKKDYVQIFAIASEDGVLSYQCN